MAKTRGPFEQAPLSRRERREADRRAAERAAARAEAMPPPDPSTRVDVTGVGSQPTYANPAPSAADQHTHQPTQPVSLPSPQPVTQQQVAPGGYPTHPTVPVHGYAQQVPAVPVLPGVEAWDPSAARPLPTSSQGSPATGRNASESASQAPNLLALVRAPWRGKWATFGLAAGSLAVVVGFAAALGWGAPVLDHSTSWAHLGAGAGAALVGVGAMSRGWANGPVRVRRSVAAVAVLLVAAFGLGVLTNPVVVDGQVFLSTSKEAHQYKMMRQIHDDLLRLRSLDVYLTYSAADAGSHYDEYDPALSELTDMSNKYAGYSADDLPDKRFVDTVAAVKSAAYWAAQAMEYKIALLTEEDARAADNLETSRTNFAEQYVAAGRALQFLSADLNIPVDTREHE